VSLLYSQLALLILECSQVEEVHETTKQVIKKELKFHVTQKAKAERLKKKLEREEHLRQEMRVAKTEAKQKAANEDVEDYRKRRELQVAQTLVIIFC
jgi:hypothetical protein